MKKQSNFLYALALFMMTSFEIVSAQSSTVVGPEFGIKGGVNMSNLYSDDVDDNNALWGFNAGVFAAFPIADNIFIQPEILYTTKGAELEYNSDILSGTSKFKLGYVEVPLLVRFNLTENFNIHVGGYASYLVNAKVSNDTEGGDGLDFEEDLDADDFERFDAGLSAGVGVDFNPISIGLRYNYGLTPIGKERDGVTFPDAKNSNLSLYLAYKLN